MCPACFATAAWVVAGATSAGGLTALVVKKFRAGPAAAGSQAPTSGTGERTPAQEKPPGAAR